MRPSPEKHPPSHYPRHALLILSAFTLSLAINRNEGTYAPNHPWAIIWLTISLLSCLASLFTPARPIDPSRHRNLLVWLLSLALAAQFIQLFLGLPGTWKNVDWSTPATEVGPLARTGIFPWRSIYQQRQQERADLESKIHDLTDVDEIHQLRRRIAEIDASLNATKFQGFITALALLAILAIPDWRRRTRKTAPTPPPSTPAPEPQAPTPFIVHRSSFILHRSSFIVSPSRLTFPLLLFAHFLLGVWIIRTNPSPHIDVFVFQQESALALMNGENPYATTFPNIYGHDRVYAEGLSVNHELQFGFPYPPGSLFLILPAYAFTGDHRYAQLLAITLSALMIATARPGLIARLAAALLLFMPKTFMILECAWTEPLVVLGLSATLFTALRAPKLLPCALGLFFATKQYMLFVAPLAYLLAPASRTPNPVGAGSPRPLPLSPSPGKGPGEGQAPKVGAASAAAAPSPSPSEGEGPGEGSSSPSDVAIRRSTSDVQRSTFTSSPFLSLLLKSITVTLLISLPLILWNPQAFIHSAVTLQLKQPFRQDALSYLAWIYHHVNPTLAPELSWLSFAILPFALALGLWKSPRTPAGFALALAVLFFAFLAFSKQAFANYYFFLFSALCWAIAVADDLPRRHEDTKAPPIDPRTSEVTA